MEQIQYNSFWEVVCADDMVEETFRWRRLVFVPCKRSKLFYSRKLEQFYLSSNQTKQKEYENIHQCEKVYSRDLCLLWLWIFFFQLKALCILFLINNIHYVSCSCDEVFFLFSLKFSFVIIHSRQTVAFH